MKTEEEYNAEVLQLMRDLYPTLKGEEKERAERLFPELKESEEYVRIDAFIEKVKSFLNKKDDRDYYTIGYIKRHLEEIIKEIDL
jgi:hypothetical protein